MTVETRKETGAGKKGLKPRMISQAESFAHGDDAWRYLKRVRARLYKDPKYRNQYIAIRDRRIVDVDADKFTLYHRVVKTFPDHRFIVSQVLSEMPSVDIG